MIPAVVVPELVAEALLFFRRALTVFRVANTAQNVSESLDSLLKTELRDHRSVVGEDAFFFLLGKQLLSRPEFARKTKLIDKQINAIVYDALTNPVFTSASADVKSTSLNFLYALGMEWALQEPAAVAIMTNSLNNIHQSFTYKDPMMDYFQSVSDVSASQQKILTELGVKPDEMKNIISSYKEGSFTSSWTNTLKKLGSTGTPVYKLHTAIGVMLAGAKAVEIRGLIEIPITADADHQFAFNLSSGYLQRGGYKDMPRETITDFRSITKEMVDQASANVMKQRGYVKVDKEWQPLAETKIEKDDDNETIFSNAASLSAVASVAQTLESKSRALSRLAKIKNLRKLIK